MHPAHQEDAESGFEAFAERFAAFMGTARFILWMSIFIVVWVSINVIGLVGLKWDPYPFILLNLVFSTQASYAAPLILMAQNKQAVKDRRVQSADHDHLTLNTELTKAIHAKVVGE